MKSLARWRPFEALAWPFPRDLNEMWRRFVAEDGGKPLFDWQPAADLLETSDAYLIKLEAPGLKADDIQVSLTGDTITIKGEKRQEEKREEDSWHVVERSYGAFQRTFTLPGVVNPDQIDARFKDGILEVKLLKSKESKTKKIAVKV